MIPSHHATDNRWSFYTVHGLTVGLDLVIVGICAWLASDAVQNQVDMPRETRFWPIIMLTAASTAALWSSILIVLAGLKVVALPLGSRYHLACTGVVIPLYVTAAIIVGISIDRIGTCKFESFIFLDHSNESCAAFWRDIQSVQIIVVVLAGAISTLLLAETVYDIRMHIKARNKRALRISIM